MSLFAAAPAAPQPSLFAAAAPAAPTAASLLSFASAPDLSRSKHAAPAAASAAASAIDLTGSSSPKHPSSSSSKRHKDDRKARKKEKRHRSDRSSRSRSRSRSRSADHSSKKSRHDRERDRDRDERKARKKRDRKEERTTRPAAPATATTAATAAASSPFVPSSPVRIDVSSSDENDNAADDAGAHTDSLHSRSAFEAAEDLRKIAAIEQRLKNAGATPAYFTSALQGVAPQSEPSAAWIKDTKGDYTHAIFGGIWRADLPLSGLAGAGQFLAGSAELGLTYPWQIRALVQKRGPGQPPPKIRRSDAREQMQYNRSQRYYHDRWHLRERDRTFKRLRRSQPAAAAAPATDEFEQGTEFISLGSAALAVAADSVGSAAAAASSAVHPVAQGASFDDVTSALTRDYNVALRKSPSNVALWLHFARAQETMMHPMRHVHAGAALAERQIVILQRALEANPHNEFLTLALLARATTVWSPPLLESFFASALQALPHSVQLWDAFLEWRCAGAGNFQRFRADDDVGADEEEGGGVHQAHARALAAMVLQRSKLLSQFQLGTAERLNAADMHARFQFQQQQLARINRAIQHFLCRYMRFLFRTGYKERALALWQAVLEFTCRSPVALCGTGAALDPTLRRRFFEAFWDSAAPRIGDAGAKGFAAWYESLGMATMTQQTEAETEPRIEPPTPLSGGKLAIADWLRLESQLDASQWLPQRSEPASVVRGFESLPSILHRVVLIDDIRDCVVDVAFAEGADRRPSFESESLAIEFVLAGIISCFDLPPQMLLVPSGGLFLNELTVAQNGSLEIRCDAARASSNEPSTLPDCFERIPLIAGVPIDDPLLAGLGVAPALIVEDHTIPASGAYAPLDLSALRRTSASLESTRAALLRASEKVRFIRAALDQLRSCYPTSTVLKTCAMAFEYNLAVAEESASTMDEAQRLYPLTAARAFARSLLQTDPANLLLLNSYALLEFAAGQHAVAAKVWTKSLGALDSIDAAPRARDGPLLFWSHANALLTRAYAPQEPDAESLVRQALHVIVCASEPGGGKFEPFDSSQPGLRPTRLLKARRAFADALSALSSSPAAAVSKSNWLAHESAGMVISPAAALCACYLWLEYLTSGIEAAQRLWSEGVLNAAKPAGSVRGSSAMSFTLGDVQHEWLGTMFVRLLSAHRSRTASFPSRLFRQPLLQLLQSFPSSSFLLSQLTASFQGGGAGASGQLRRFFDQATSGFRWSVDSDRAGAKTEEDGPSALVRRAEQEQDQSKPASLIVWLHAISSELHRPGAIHRVSTLLERALQPSSGLSASSCLVLWRLFLRVQVCKSRVGAASKLLYRALHANPSSLRMWLEGIEWIHALQSETSAAFSSSSAAPAAAPSSASLDPDSSAALSLPQICELFDLLQEKGLRHRANLLPERESDSEYRPVQRAWDAALRSEREARERAEARREAKAQRRMQREKEGRNQRSRSRSRSGSESEDESDDGSSRSRSSSRSSSRSRRHHRRRRSRSRSPSRSSSEERWREQRRRERAPLPERPRSRSKSRSPSRSERED